MCRVPSPLAEDSKAQMIFVCDDAFQHVSKSHVSLRLFILFRGSGSEPGSPRLGQLTHPDGVFGWRLPSDPGSLALAHGMRKHMAEGEQHIYCHIMSSVTNGALAG